MAAARSIVVPTVFYRDPVHALRWLENAFGFEATTVLTDGAGGIALAEVSFRGAQVGVGGEWTGEQIGGVKMVSPKALDQPMCTSLIWIAMDDGLDEHCEQARRAGAKIVQEPMNQFYGDRTYRAIDHEGHVWCFRQKVQDVSVKQMEDASGLTVTVKE